MKLNGWKICSFENHLAMKCVSRVLHSFPVLFLCCILVMTRLYLMRDDYFIKQLWVHQCVRFKEMNGKQVVLNWSFGCVILLDPIVANCKLYI